MGILRTERSMVRAMCRVQLKDRKTSADLVFIPRLINETIDQLAVEVSIKVGLRRKDALCRSNWSVGVNKISAGSR